MTKCMQFNDDIALDDPDKELVFRISRIFTETIRSFVAFHAYENSFERVMISCQESAHFHSIILTV